MVGGVDEDVPRLHVAMHEPTAVRGVEGVRDLADENDRALRWERAVLEQRAQVRAVDEAAGQVQLALGLARGVHGEDARVVDGGREPRLAEEPLPERVVPGELGSDELQRDRPVERQLGRSVHDSHSTPSNDAFDPVAGELSSDLWHLEIRFSTVRSTK